MDVEERIFEKLDKIEDRITDLCLRLSALEVNHQNHIDDLEKKHNSRMKRRDGVIAMIGGVLGVVELLRIVGVI
jgi:hypothetical protein